MLSAVCVCVGRSREKWKRKAVRSRVVVKRGRFSGTLNFFFLVHLQCYLSQKDKAPLGFFRPSIIMTRSSEATFNGHTKATSKHIFAISSTLLISVKIRHYSHAKIVLLLDV